MDCSTLSGITVESAKEHLRKVRACKMHNELTNSMEDGTFATHGAHPSVLGGTDIRWVFGANLYNIWYPLILTYLLKKWTVRMECAKRTDPPKKGVVRACVRASCARCRLFESPDIHCHDLLYRNVCNTAYRKYVDSYTLVVTSTVLFDGYTYPAVSHVHIVKSHYFTKICSNAEQMLAFKKNVVLTADTVAKAAGVEAIAASHAMVLLGGFPEGTREQYVLRTDALVCMCARACVRVCVRVSVRVCV